MDIKETETREMERKSIELLLQDAMIRTAQKLHDQFYDYDVLDYTIEKNKNSILTHIWLEQEGLVDILGSVGVIYNYSGSEGENSEFRIEVEHINETTTSYNYRILTEEKEEQKSVFLEEKGMRRGRGLSSLYAPIEIANLSRLLAEDAISYLKEKKNDG